MVIKSEYQARTVDAGKYLNSSGLDLKFIPKVIEILNGYSGSNESFRRFTFSMQLILMAIYSCCKYALARDLKCSPQQITAEQMAETVFNFSVSKMAEILYGNKTGVKKTDTPRTRLHYLLHKLSEVNFAGKDGGSEDQVIRAWFTRGHDVQITFGLQTAQILETEGEYLLLKPQEFAAMHEQCGVQKLTGNELAVLLTMMTEARAGMVKHGRAEVKSVKEQVLELSQRLFGADACRKIRSMHYLLGRLIIKQIWSAGIGLCAQLCALLQKILRGSQAMAKYHSKVIRGESKGWKRSGQAEKASIYAAVPVMAAAAAYS